MSRSRVVSVPGIVVLSNSGYSAPFTLSQSAPASLEEGFKNPPNSARPHVWWRWMNGNITKEGIKVDLEWMNRVGLWRVSEFRRLADDPEVGRPTFGLHDAGMERCIPQASSTLRP